MKVLKPDWINHNGMPICSIDIHPDGSRVATGGQGEDSGRIVIWNMSPILSEEKEIDENVPRMLCQLDNHLACVNCVRWSSSGKFLASGGDDKLVMVWTISKSHGGTSLFGSKNKCNLEGWRCAFTLRSHEGDVLDIAWSPRDRWLATCSVDNTIIVWSAENLPDVASVLRGHTGLVKGVSWDPVGKYLSSQSDDKSVRIWRTSDWKLETLVSSPFDKCTGTTLILRLSWSPDGLYLVTAHAMNGPVPTAQIIEREGWTHDKDFVGHRMAITCVRFSPRIMQMGRGRACAVALGSRDRSISVWLTRLARPLVVVEDLFASPVLDLTWSPNGLSLMAVSTDGSAAVLDFTREEMGTPITDNEKMNLFEKLYGRRGVEGDALDGMGGSGGGAIVIENPEILAATVAAQEVSQMIKHQSSKPPRMRTEGKSVRSGKPPKSGTTATPVRDRPRTPSVIPAESLNNVNNNIVISPSSNNNVFFTPSSNSNTASQVALGNSQQSTSLTQKHQIETKTKDGKRRITPIHIPSAQDFNEEVVPFGSDSVMSFSSSCVGAKSKIIVEVREEGAGDTSRVERIFQSQSAPGATQAGKIIPPPSIPLPSSTNPVPQLPLPPSSSISTNIIQSDVGPGVGSSVLPRPSINQSLQQTTGTQAQSRDEGGGYSMLLGWAERGEVKRRKLTNNSSLVGSGGVVREGASMAGAQGGPVDGSVGVAVMGGLGADQGGGIIAPTGKRRRSGVLLGDRSQQQPLPSTHHHSSFIQQEILPRLFLPSPLTTFKVGTGIVGDRDCIEGGSIEVENFTKKGGQEGRMAAVRYYPFVPQTQNQQKNHPVKTPLSVNSHQPTELMEKKSTGPGQKQTQPDWELMIGCEVVGLVIGSTSGLAHRGGEKGVVAGVGGRDGSLRLLDISKSGGGRPLVPPLSLPSPPAFLRMTSVLKSTSEERGRGGRSRNKDLNNRTTSNHTVLMLLAISSDGSAFTWSLDPLPSPIIYNLSIRPTLNSHDGSNVRIKDCLVSEKGEPRLALTSGRSYAYSLKHKNWLLVGDGSDPVAMNSLRTYTRHPPYPTSSDKRSGGDYNNFILPLKSIQSAALVPSASQNNPQQHSSNLLPSANWFGSGGGRRGGSLSSPCTRSFLESQLISSLALNSPQEYKHWLLSLVRFLIQSGGLERRVRAICEDLLGPTHSSTSHSSWEPKILGLEKHSLLKEILSEMSSHVPSQRLYLELKAQLEGNQSSQLTIIKNELH